MASDIKKDISQIRRCQKTVNVIGLILPPTSYDNLLDIMMVVVVFCNMLTGVMKVSSLLY